MKEVRFQLIVGEHDVTISSTKIVSYHSFPVMKMSLGEKAELNISSDYGYGDEGAGGVIPPNADLVFVVELLKIGAMEAKVSSSSACCIVM